MNLPPLNACRENRVAESTLVFHRPTIEKALCHRDGAATVAPADGVFFAHTATSKGGTVAASLLAKCWSHFVEFPSKNVVISLIQSDSAEDGDRVIPPAASAKTEGCLFPELSSFELTRLTRLYSENTRDRPGCTTTKQPMTATVGGGGV